MIRAPLPQEGLRVKGQRSGGQSLSQASSGRVPGPPQAANVARLSCRGEGLWAQSNSLPCKGQALGFTAEGPPGPGGLHTLTGQSNRMRVPEESSVIIGR